MAQDNYFDQFDDKAAAAKQKREAAKDEASAASGFGSAASSNASAERSKSLLPSEVRTSTAKARSAEAQAAIDEAAASKAAPDEETKEFERKKKIEDVNNLLANVAQARRALGFWGTGPGGQVAKGLWGTPAQDLSAAIDGIRSPIVLQALQEARKGSVAGATGFGALSERELNIIASTIASLKQGQSEEELSKNLNRIETHFRRFAAYNNGLDPDSPEGTHFAGLVNPDAENKDPGEGKIRGDKAEVTDPELAGANATIEAMIRAGRTPDQIRAWLNEVQPGAGDRALNVEANVDAWKQGIEPNADVEINLVPKGGISKLIGETADSPIGAALIGAGDAASFGFLDELTPEQRRSEAIMRTSGEKRPGATMVGQFAGGVGTGLGLESLSARYLPRVPSLLGDVAQGMLYGAGSGSEGNRLESALASGVIAAGGGMATRGVMRGGGALFRGVQDPMANLLARYNIPMTIGQLTRGTAKAREDRLTSTPIVGANISARRREGLEAFNRAAFDEALVPIGGTTAGEVGQNGVARAQQLVSDAYRQALDGVDLVPDADFVTTLQRVRPDVASVPRVGEELDADIGRIVNTYIDPSGNISGQNLQAARQEIRDLKKAYKTAPDTKRLYNQIKPHLDEIEDAYTGLLGRQFPDRVEPFLNADEAYKRAMIVGDAVDYATANNEGLFMPSQLRQRTRQSTRKFGGVAASQRGARPFNELIEAGSAILPSSVPNSGTAERMLLPLLAASTIGGGSYAGQRMNADGEPVEGERTSDAMSSTALGLTGAALVSLPYSRLGQATAQRMLLGNRPEASRWLGDKMVQYANPFARGAVPVLSNYGIDRVPDPEVEDEDPGLISYAKPADLPEGAKIDPETGEIIMPDGERIPLKGYADGGSVERTWGDTTREAGKGATFAWGDELEALARSVARGDPGRYYAIKDGINRRMEAAYDASPLAATGWEMAGAIAPAALAKKPAAVDASLGRLASRYPRAAAAVRARPRTAGFVAGAIPDAAMAALYAMGEADRPSDIPQKLVDEVPMAMAMYGGLGAAGSGLKRLYRRYIGGRK